MWLLSTAGGVLDHSSLQTVSELSREEELTRVDHKLNLHASIIGLAVGQNKVYVNCRRFVE